MRFSIVIPLFNKEQYIAETLDSVIHQTFDDYEVIIVNDSSTDRSLSIVKSFEIKDSRFNVYTIPNGGVSNARNFGIKRSRGEYVCFLDADDLWKPDYLKEANSLIEKYGKSNFLCFAYEWFEDNPQNVVKHCSLEKYFKGDKQIDFFKYSVLSKASVALTSAVIIRRSRLMELDYCFPKEYSMGEDVDLWVRSAKESIIYSNKALMLYRCFTPNGLMNQNYGNISKEFPYWQWYNLKGYGPYKNKFTTRMIYGMSRRKGLADGRIIRMCLKHSKGTYLLLNRIIVFILSYIKY